MRRIKNLPWNWKTLYKDIGRSTVNDGQFGFLSSYFPRSWTNFFDRGALRP